MLRLHHIEAESIRYHWVRSGRSTLHCSAIVPNVGQSASLKIYQLTLLGSYAGVSHELIGATKKSPLTLRLLVDGVKHRFMDESISWLIQSMQFFLFTYPKAACSRDAYSRHCEPHKMVFSVHLLWCNLLYINVSFHLSGLINLIQCLPAALHYHSTFFL